MTDVPNLARPWRAMTAPGRYRLVPGQLSVAHGDRAVARGEKRITIRKGEPLCRVMPVRRDTYFAQQMPPARSTTSSPAASSGSPRTARCSTRTRTVDITRTYVRQQVKSKFVVMR